MLRLFSIAIFSVTFMTGCQKTEDLSQLVQTIGQTHGWAQKAQNCLKLTEAEQQAWVEDAVVFGLLGQGSPIHLGVAQQACVQRVQQEWQEALAQINIPMFEQPPQMQWAQDGVRVKGVLGQGAPQWMHGVGISYAWQGSSMQCTVLWPDASPLMLEALRQSLELPCRLETRLHE